MRRTFALSLVLILLASPAALAQTTARVSGKIIDGSTKEPIPNVEIKYESTGGKNIKMTAKSKADGTYAVAILDGTLKYKFTFSAPGYVTYEETFKPNIGAANDRPVELFKKGAAAPAAGGVEAKPDSTVVAYNEGAELFNAGDIDGAILKFTEAVTAKPDLLAGWTALAKAHLRQKSYPKALEAANKVLDVDDTDTDMLTVAHQAYLAMGDKANAAKLETKLPKNAALLFNDAAKLINSGNDAGAEGLLKQAIAADPAFAQSYYELGMIYVRSGKSAEAKENLTKYIELDPKGRDVATAKEMLGYL